MGQFDIKDEDVIFKDDGNGMKATPMDGGAAMPDSATLEKFLLGNGAETPGGNLLNDPDIADAEMDEELIQAFLSIDADALKQTAANEVAQIQQGSGLDPAALGLDANDQESGISVMAKAIQGIQALLKDPNGKPVKMKTEEFVRMFESEVIHKVLIPPNKKQAFEQKVLTDYQNLQAQNPGLLEDSNDPVNIYRFYLSPEAFKEFTQLQALAQPGTVLQLCNKYLLSVPLTSFSKKVSSVVAGQEAFANGKKLLEEQMAKVLLSKDKTEQAPLIALAKKASQGLDQNDPAAFEAAMKKLRPGTKAIEERLAKEFSDTSAEF